MNFIFKSGCMYSSVALEYQKQSFYYCLMAFVRSLLLPKHCPFMHLYMLHCTRIYELVIYTLYKLN